MNLNADLYDLTQQTQGQLIVTMQKLHPQILEALPALPPLLQVRGGL